MEPLKLICRPGIEENSKSSGDKTGKFKLLQMPNEMSKSTATQLVKLPKSSDVLPPRLLNLPEEVPSKGFSIIRIPVSHANVTQSPLRLLRIPSERQQVVDFTPSLVRLPICKSEPPSKVPLKLLHGRPVDGTRTVQLIKIPEAGKHPTPKLLISNTNRLSEPAFEGLNREYSSNKSAEPQASASSKGKEARKLHRERAQDRRYRVICEDNTANIPLTAAPTVRSRSTKEILSDKKTKKRSKWGRLGLLPLIDKIAFEASSSEASDSDPELDVLLNYLSHSKTRDRHIKKKVKLSNVLLPKTAQADSALQKRSVTSSCHKGVQVEATPRSPSWSEIMVVKTTLHEELRDQDAQLQTHLTSNDAILNDLDLPRISSVSVVPPQNPGHLLSSTEHGNRSVAEIETMDMCKGALYQSSDNNRNLQEISKPAPGKANDHVTLLQAGILQDQLSLAGHETPNQPGNESNRNDKQNQILQGNVKYPHITLQMLSLNENGDLQSVLPRTGKRPFLDIADIQSAADNSAQFANIQEPESTPPKILINELHGMFESVKLEADLSDTARNGHDRNDAQDTGYVQFAVDENQLDSSLLINDNYRSSPQGLASIPYCHRQPQQDLSAKKSSEQKSMSRIAKNVSEISTQLDALDELHDKLESDMKESKLLMRTVNLLEKIRSPSMERRYNPSYEATSNHAQVIPHSKASKDWQFSYKSGTSKRNHVGPKTNSKESSIVTDSSIKTLKSTHELSFAEEDRSSKRDDNWLSNFQQNDQLSDILAGLENNPALFDSLEASNSVQEYRRDLVTDQSSDRYALKLQETSRLGYSQLAIDRKPTTNRNERTKNGSRTANSAQQESIKQASVNFRNAILKRKRDERRKLEEEHYDERLQNAQKLFHEMNEVPIKVTGTKERAKDILKGTYKVSTGGAKSKRKSGKRAGNRIRQSGIVQPTDASPVLKVDATRDWDTDSEIERSFLHSGHASPHHKSIAERANEFVTKKSLEHYMTTKTKRVKRLLKDSLNESSSFQRTASPTLFSSRSQARSPAQGRHGVNVISSGNESDTAQLLREADALLRRSDVTDMSSSLGRASVEEVDWNEVDRILAED